MNKKVIICLFFTICFSLVLIACSNNSNVNKKEYVEKYSHWQDVAVSNIAIFKVPTTLEMQTKEYRDIARLNNPYYPEPPINKVIFQQKGLLEAAKNRKNINEHYVRVIFEVKDIGADSGLRIGKSLKFTKEEKDAFKDMYIQGITANSTSNFKFFDFSDVEIRKSSFGEYLLIANKRQLNDNPVVQVFVHMIFDKDKMYVLTTEYRIEEFNIWCQNDNDIRKVIDTVKIFDK